MRDLILYIHGKGGSAAESEHYRPLFPDCVVIGLDYHTFTPWETGKEIREAAERLKAGHDGIVLIANSIGAYFSMHAGIDAMIRRAYFISPIVDMEKLILDMAAWDGITEKELEARGRSGRPLARNCPGSICAMSGSTRYAGMRRQKSCTAGAICFPPVKQSPRSRRRTARG